MAIKKSVLYSSLWASCDQLRGAGSMDASQYKDYVLTMLFLKYVSDKHAGDPNSILLIPEGCSFEDVAKAKGKPNIGEVINTSLAEIAKANGLEGKLALPDFEKNELLGEGKTKVELLTKLVAIFENPNLDFRNNRAEDDDLLGDAYEYLMRHFATQSGKSKGQFYTPAEVSRVLAQLVGVERATNSQFTVYDMTCGSGSLLLKVAAQAPVLVSLYGQEKDYSTKGLAIMNMFLHGHDTAEIEGGNTLSDPAFQVKGKPFELKRFDICVANPPFSQKNWTTGVNPAQDAYGRFQGHGIPPEKNGDYAFMLHMLKSMKSDGKGAIILPHGVLFRGNAEAVIRQDLIERRWIKGIIGLPPNLFYGTGIPACIILLDKADTDTRDGIFMIDASKGYVKDGNKNRLREQDIHQIVDAFKQQLEQPRYARLVPWAEIEAQEYNLNLPRYIDTQAPEDRQDLAAHLNGGIPEADIDALQAYWSIYPQLRQDLFQPLRPGYQRLTVPLDQLKTRIYTHPEFEGYRQQLEQAYEDWKQTALPLLQGIDANTSPKQLIHQLAERLLQAYQGRPLVDAYHIYQHLMDYWEETLKDDVYLVVEEGWTAKVDPILAVAKSGKDKGKEVEKGWEGTLVPKPLFIEHYLTEQAATLQATQTELERLQAERDSLQEEHGGEDALLEAATNDKGYLSETELKAFVKQYKKDPEEAEAVAVAQQLLTLFAQEKEHKKALKTQTLALDKAARDQYPQLTSDQVQTLLLHHKWLPELHHRIQTEIEQISQRLTTRLQTLAERYATPLSELDQTVEQLEQTVLGHLEKMGLKW